MDQIPFFVTCEILARVPVESVLDFACTSRASCATALHSSVLSRLTARVRRGANPTAAQLAKFGEVIVRDLDADALAPVLPARVRIEGPDWGFNFVPAPMVEHLHIDSGWCQVLYEFEFFLPSLRTLHSDVFSNGGISFVCQETLEKQDKLYGRVKVI